ncbi:MAG: HAD family hydrolase [Thermodesulfobacteriota bacterium]
MIDCEAIVFDLDGTLIDSLYDLGNSVNKALSTFGYPEHDIDKYKNYIGDGTEVMVTKALPEDKKDQLNIKKCLDKFNEIYEHDFNVNTRLYDGISSLLDKLIENKIRLSILTNKPYKFTEKYVESHLKCWEFDVVIAHKEGLPRKPDPSGALIIINELKVDCSKIIYLGDTGIDMITAVRAGMYPIGVLWGFREKEELLSNGAACLIENPLELMSLIN